MALLEKFFRQREELAKEREESNRKSRRLFELTEKEEEILQGLKGLTNSGDPLNVSCPGKAEKGMASSREEIPGPDPGTLRMLRVKCDFLLAEMKEELREYEADDGRERTPAEEQQKKLLENMLYRTAELRETLEIAGEKTEMGNRMGEFAKETEEESRFRKALMEYENGNGEGGDGSG